MRLKTFIENIYLLTFMLQNKLFFSKTHRSMQLKFFNCYKSDAIATPNCKIVKKQKKKVFFSWKCFILSRIEFCLQNKFIVNVQKLTNNSGKREPMYNVSRKTKHNFPVGLNYC